MLSRESDKVPGTMLWRGRPRARWPGIGTWMLVVCGGAIVIWGVRWIRAVDLARTQFNDLGLVGMAIGIGATMVLGPPVYRWNQSRTWYAVTDEVVAQGLGSRSSSRPIASLAEVSVLGDGAGRAMVVMPTAPATGEVSPSVVGSHDVGGSAERATSLLGSMVSADVVLPVVFTGLTPEDADAAVRAIELAQRHRRRLV